MIKDMFREHRSSFLILMETHATGDAAARVGSRVGLDGLFMEEARGQA